MIAKVVLPTHLVFPSVDVAVAEMLYPIAAGKPETTALAAAVPVTSIIPVIGEMPLPETVYETMSISARLESISEKRKFPLSSAEFDGRREQSTVIVATLNALRPNNNTLR